jgi:hypothetical protein
MKLTTFKKVKIGDTFYVPDAKEGTNKLNRTIKMSGKEAFGNKGKIEYSPSFSVYVQGNQ